MKSEIHLFILWQRARHKEREILQDMEKHFSILKLYAITWSPKLVSSNFTRFYGVNLPNNSFIEKECGTGEFLLCVVRDEHPVYEERMTSRGPEIVNSNMFDAKERYRSWTGGRHKIHGTNSEKETNHDLTLLIGKNVDDFLRDNQSSKTPKVLKKDIEGAYGWASISQLFYVLNNTVSYVVLRGYKELITPNPQEDVDILTDEYNNMWLIINAKSFLSHVRPKAGVFIGDDVYYLDIWDAKKDYYDLIWMRKMLSGSIMKDGIRVLDEENDFYCLLYHCLTNKGSIAPKHLPKLNQYKQTFHIEEKNWSKILVDWLKSHKYDIIKHKDPSNPFIISDPLINEYATRWGICIRIVDLKTLDKLNHQVLQWESRVYKKENSFIKKGTPWLINNESRILSSIHSSFTPSLIAKGTDGSTSWIEISRLSGVTLGDFFEDRKNYTIENIRKIIIVGVLHLSEIYHQGIMHRDITPDNILISKSQNELEWNLIDFGSAIMYATDNDFPSPWYLGAIYVPESMYSDFYSYGKVLMSICRKMPYIQRIANELMKVQWENYTDTLFVEQIVQNVYQLSKRRLTLRDFYALYRKKYASWRKYIESPRLAIKKIKSKIRRLIK